VTQGICTIYYLFLLPKKAVNHVAQRSHASTRYVGLQRIALENVSYYAAPCQDLNELEFLLAVLNKADCDLMLDVNNVFVNSINHRYNPYQFIDALPKERIRYLHIAGHYVEAEDLRIDTHGAAICDDVWHLLAHTYKQFGVLPTLLERDFNIPPLNELLAEVQKIRDYQEQAYV
jgi:uncharacterized protein (UPF0276 family)